MAATIAVIFCCKLSEFYDFFVNSLLILPIVLVINNGKGFYKRSKTNLSRNTQLKQ